MADKMIEHEISQEDLDLNPELVEEGVKVGDIIEYPEPLEVGTPAYKKAMKSFLKSEKAKKLKQKDDSDVIALLRGVADSIGGLNRRIDGIQDEVKAIKNGNQDAFKKGAKDADIEKSSKGREGVDPKVVQIVDETLGTDFGIELAPLGDRPGFMLTLIVPDRLNDNVIDKRPVREENGEYKRGPDQQVVMEDYKLPDRRSRVLSTSDSYEAVRQHCERVRAYTVAYYQKMNRTVPELRVR